MAEKTNIEIAKEKIDKKLAEMKKLAEDSKKKIQEVKEEKTNQ